MLNFPYDETLYHLYFLFRKEDKDRKRKRKGKEGGKERGSKKWKRKGKTIHQCSWQFKKVRKKKSLILLLCPDQQIEDYGTLCTRGFKSYFLTAEGFCCCCCFTSKQFQQQNCTLFSLRSDFESSVAKMFPFTKPVKPKCAPTFTKLFRHWLSLLGIRKLLSKLISQCLLSWVMAVQEHLLFSGNVWGQWGNLIVSLSEWSVPPQPGNFP